MYALVELSGDEHMEFIDEPLYFYNLPDDGRRGKIGCTVAHIRYHSNVAKAMVPFKQLNSLQEEVQHEDGYKAPT